MSLTSSAFRQIARAKSETERSLASVRSLRDQWLVATGQNPTGLTQKQIDHLSKAFKNQLLSVKWDCEDLEELVNVEQNCKGSNNLSRHDNDNDPTTNEFLIKTRCLIGECREEISKSMHQLEDIETNKKIFNKHGITTTNNNCTPAPNDTVAQAVGPVASIIQNPLHGALYERLSEDQQQLMLSDSNAELPHFDKSQIESCTTIFNNALYDHFEDDEVPVKSVNATNVFNNLTRPNSDTVCVRTNENEMILEMLETEYYNPPEGLLAKSNYATTLRDFFDASRSKYLGTIAFLFTFPIILILFLVI